jgi:WD40 repeat protein
VRVWDVETGEERGRWPGHAAAVYSVAFSPDGRLAVSGGADRVVRLWDVASGKQLRGCAGHANPVVRVAFGRDGRHVLAGSSRYNTPDALVRAWDADGARESSRFEGAALGRVECLAFSPDGRQVLLGLADGELRLSPLDR